MNGKDSLCMHIENVPSTLSDILESAHNVWQTSLTSRNDQHITSPFKIHTLSSKQEMRKLELVREKLISWIN